MALEEITRGQEILIRLKNDATGANVIGGAQYQTITEILKNGVVISAQMNDPIPLSLVGDGDSTLARLLGEVSANALVQNEALQASLANVNAIAAQQLASLTQAQEKITQLTTTNDQLVQDYQAQISGLNSQVSDLQATVADLQAQLDAAQSAARPAEEVADAEKLEEVAAE